MTAATNSAAMAPSTSFRHDVFATWPQWLVALASSAAVTWWLAGAWDAAPLVQGVTWLLSGFVLLPVGFAVGLAAVALVLTSLLSLLALPVRLTGRATGLRELLVELWSLVGQVLPGFWQALRRVRRPGMWGALLGFVLAVALLAIVDGLPPAA